MKDLDLEPVKNWKFLEALTGNTAAEFKGTAIQAIEAIESLSNQYNLTLALWDGKINESH